LKTLKPSTATTKSTSLDLDLEILPPPLLLENQPETMKNKNNKNIVETGGCARFIVYDKKMKSKESDKKRFGIF